MNALIEQIMILRREIEHGAFDQLICQDIDIDRMTRWSGPGGCAFGFAVDGCVACTISQRFDGREDGSVHCVFALRWHAPFEHLNSPP